MGEDKVYQLDTLVLIGDSPGELIEAPESYAVSVLELTPEEIQNLSLEDLLESQVSVQVRSIGGRADYSTVSIRGASASQVKVYVDGVELNSGDAAAVDLSTLNLNRFERVEIYRSHAPARFGLGALGGVVHLISRRDKESRGSLKMGVGSYGFLEGRLDHTLLKGGSIHQFQFHHQQEDGDFVFTDDNLTPELTVDDVERRRINNDFESMEARWSGSHDFNLDQKMLWGLGYFERDKGLAGRAKSQSSDVRYEEEHLDLEAGYRHHGMLNEESTLFFNWNHRRQKNRYLDPADQLGTSLGGQDERYDFESHDLRLVHEHNHAVAPWSFSLLHRREAQVTEDHQLNLSQAKRSRRSWNPGLDVNFYLFDQRLELRPSMSAQLLKDSFSTSSHSKEHWSWNLTALWRALDHLDIRAGLSRGVRVPGFSELFGDRGSIVGNPSLIPERSQNVDMGLAFHGLAFQPVRSLGMELTIFRSDRKDLIQMVFDARGIGRSQNLGEGVVEGFEWSGSADFDHGIQLGWNLTMMRTEQRSSVFAGGKSLKIPGIYEQIASSSLQWKHDAWTTRYELRLAGDKFYNTANTTIAPDQEEHHFSIQYRQKRWNLALDIENFTDENLEDFYQWPRQGRTIIFSAMYNY